jgi:exosome complex RNA-binding protein Rrp42 (RNase PH superfamily)
MDARLTMTTTEDGNLCAIQKGCSGSFSREEIERAYVMAREKATELRKLLE